MSSILSVYGTAAIKVRHHEDEEMVELTFAYDDGTMVAAVMLYDVSPYDLQHAIEKALHEEDEGYSI